MRVSAKIELDKSRILERRGFDGGRMDSMPDTSHDLKKVIDSPEVTIYQGDALRVLRALPDCSVDAVLTDPPYSSGGVHLSAKLADPGTKYQRSDTVKRNPALLGDHKDQRSHAYWSTLWLAECWRVTKDGGASARGTAPAEPALACRLMRTKMNKSRFVTTKEEVVWLTDEEAAAEDEDEATADRGQQL